jgi:hypothetical protein
MAQIFFVPAETMVGLHLVPEETVVCWDLPVIVGIPEEPLSEREGSVNRRMFCVLAAAVCLDGILISLLKVE